MAVSLNHDHHAGNPALFDSFIFESIGLMLLSGDFVDVGDVDFMAYLALGLGPTLYPLYCPMALHDETLETQQSKEVPGVYNVGCLIVPNECITSDTVMSGDVVQAYGFNDAIMADPHHGDQCMISEDLTNDNASEVVMSNPPTVYSWILYSANMTDNAAISANIGVEELEEVASLISSTPMSNENVLRLANPSLSEFIYDVKRLALCSIGHPQAGFDFDDVAVGVLLIDTVQGVLQQFIRPRSNTFPIKDNGFAWFLGHQMAKEVMWHIVFRPSSTCGVRLVLADLEPAAFRNADHPPFSTMALLGSVYPTPAQVYDQLCETAVELVEIHDDQDHPKLMTDLSNLCKIV
ncbi:hypothetical protein BD769DRAFT_1389508 [Suillus cothurnatus]|nr:hypothetical protein BD769DRAFT_1389508 [Suillus cothurnatus]